MSDFPFKKGDLVKVMTSQLQYKGRTVQGVIVAIGSHIGYFDILIDGEIKSIHRNYIVTPRIKSTKIKGGVK